MSLAELTTPSTTRAWQATPHPTSSLLAVATADKCATIWSLRDFRLLSSITQGHKRSIRSVAWKHTSRKDPSTGETVLATGSFDSNTGVWVRNEGRSKVGGRILGAPGEYVDDEDGGFGDGVEVADGDEEEEWLFASLLTGPDSEIKSVAFSPTNTSLLATSSRDKSVWVWEDVGGGRGDDSEYETVAVMEEHTGDVKCVAWHPEREVIASGSYDDTVRLWREVEEEGDWCCVGVLEGHDGTVWGVSWETRGKGDEEDGMWEPRLASCSDDLSIRIWKKESRDKEKTDSGPRMPSIIRPASSMEEWVLEAKLPQEHVRSIYAVAWSSATGLMVSCGGDGGIYVYKEVPVDEPQTNGTSEDVVMNGTEGSHLAKKPQTNWVLVASVEAAHAEYEVNHVCWARRQDRDKRSEDEEVIVSSGDDGVVRVWTLPAL